jgi:hypothetical protein
LSAGHGKRYIHFQLVIIISCHFLFLLTCSC